MSEVKVNTVSERTAANGVTVDGLSIKDAKLVTANSVITANITDDAVTLAKMASGTDGNIISYDASGNPVAVATGTDGQVLTSAGAGAPPAFETPASAANTPAFLVTRSSGQSISNNTWTKIDWNNEIVDTNTAFASGKFVVPSGAAGLYWFNATSSMSSITDGAKVDLAFYKNGSRDESARFNNYASANGQESHPGVTGTINLAVSDYVEVYTVQNTGGSIDINANQAQFSGFKLIT